MNLIHTLNLGDDLAAQLNAIEHDKLFVLCDDTTRELCLPLISSFPCMQAAHTITIPPTDDHKTLQSLSHVWAELGRIGASRRSLLICLGGGMVTDLGGFAAATFKRGISFINIPTTLLAQVDASVGGKTGINFAGLKNEIGVFRDANAVLICPWFLRTLDTANIRSGYAEMLKHGLISTDKHLAELLTFDLQDPDLTHLSAMVATSVAVKENIVLQDPTEHGLRKALNLGHTAAHALESHAMLHQHTVLHGYAVAWGLVCELYLSAQHCGFPTKLLHQVTAFVKHTYGQAPITCEHYDELFALMTHDKKNHDGQILCTLLRGVGDIALDQPLTRQQIDEMFDYLREA